MNAQFTLGIMEIFHISFVKYTTEFSNYKFYCRSRAFKDLSKSSETAEVLYLCKHSCS